MLKCCYYLGKMIPDPKEGEEYTYKSKVKDEFLYIGFHLYVVPFFVPWVAFAGGSAWVGIKLDSKFTKGDIPLFCPLMGSTGFFIGIIPSIIIDIILIPIVAFFCLLSLPFLLTYAMVASACESEDEETVDSNV